MQEKSFDRWKSLGKKKILIDGSNWAEKILMDGSTVASKGGRKSLLYEITWASEPTGPLFSPEAKKEGEAGKVLIDGITGPRWGLTGQQENFLLAVNATTAYPEGSIRPQWQLTLSRIRC